MATSRISTSSVLQGFPKSRSLLAGNTAYDPAATWLIQRQTLTSNQASITFSSIPTGYTSLQIRFIGRSTRAAADANIRLQFNSDTGTNYTYHELSGSGTAASSGGAASQTYADFGRAPGTTITNTSIFGVGIVDIIDYLSTSKNKTIRSIYGYDTNGTPSEIGMRSSVWMSTSAITSITLFQASSASWLSGSTVALYGMKG
jgi:hypothetical protein